MTLAAAADDVLLALSSGGFADRHHGQSEADLAAMLEAVGVSDLEELIERTVPASIRLSRELDLPEARTEAEALAEIRAIADRNVVTPPLLGCGYHGTHTPPVILRNVLENPLWYTPYTPYQAEIAQGRLEGLLNFQTVISDLTGLPIAGASLLDEATAAAEAMAMCHGHARGRKPRFCVDAGCHPQTLSVLRTRASGLGIELAIGDVAAGEAADTLAGGDVSGVFVQNPTTDGRLIPEATLEAIAARVHEHGALLVAACDPLSLLLLEAPASWGADIAIGSAQRFGVPLGFGGPHPAFLSTREDLARKMPGRLIGVSRDARGNPALRMAIQTREQHIKRDRATSNICTAQALLANVAGFYCVWHGAEGLRAIARHCVALASGLANALRERGLATEGSLPEDGRFFDTVAFAPRDHQAFDRAADAGFDLRRFADGRLGITVDETTTPEILGRVLAALSGELNGAGDNAGDNAGDSAVAPRTEAAEALFSRRSAVLEHEVFRAHRTEHAMMRYLNRLVSRDYGLSHGMIPLGSCTMKLNAAAEMLPLTWPAFGGLHPHAPATRTAGYRQLFDDLERDLAEVTGFAAVSLQPNAGSQGEYAGLLAIRGYHEANGHDGVHKPARDVCLIPTSAHGTNPASAVIAGMRVVPLACADNGDIDLADLEAKCVEHADRLGALMITYPSTHGVFETQIRRCCEIVHEHGGQVYMDGANMNAQVGLTSPGAIGADVCHLNLHKTFCIPHGGGGPGMGPIGVAEHLAPHLPGDPQNPATTNAVSAAAFGSPSILTISWMYIRMMGPTGLKQASERAILNANYLAARLRGSSGDGYAILYTGPRGNVAHEFILDVRPFEKSAGVTVDDFAKRLMDHGFHAPTMSWPVAGTLMAEPTESETKAELDRFCDAMLAIREEIRQVENGLWPRDDNPLHHAPHTAEAVTDEAWDHPYTRQQAAFPSAAQREPGAKFWPSVARIDNPWGDRNLVCSCAGMEAFA